MNALYVGFVNFAERPTLSLAVYMQADYNWSRIAVVDTLTLALTLSLTLSLSLSLSLSLPHTLSLSAPRMRSILYLIHNDTSPPPRVHRRRSCSYCST